MLPSSPELRSVSDWVVRAAAVAAVVVLAIVVARLAGRWSRPAHPPIALTGLGREPGVVMFTSTDCTTCHDARARVESLGVPFREVTYELEQKRFEAAGVVAVPLTVVVDAGGQVLAQFTGVPPRRALARAVARVAS